MVPFTQGVALGFGVRAFQARLGIGHSTIFLTGRRAKGFDPFSLKG